MPIVRITALLIAVFFVGCASHLPKEMPEVFSFEFEHDYRNVASAPEAEESGDTVVAPVMMPAADALAAHLQKPRNGCLGLS